MTKPEDQPLLMPDFEARSRACELYGWTMQVESFVRGTFLSLVRKSPRKVTYNNATLDDHDYRVFEMEISLEDFVREISKP